jgi:hypothetical protein
MKHIGSKIIVTLLLLIVCQGPAAVSVEDVVDEAVKPGSTQEKGEEDITPRDAARLTAVKTVSFYLLNGRPVAGRLISEDKNQITVEELDESKIFVSTYSKKEIDSRTIHPARMPEVKYYLDLAEYFESRIWDFRDDPDDFTHAIRFYEKAGQIIEQSQERIPTSTAQIEDKIRSLKEQKELWAKNVKARAELKKLEFEATFDVRLDELSNEVDGLAQALRQISERLEGLAKKRQDNFRKFENRLSRINNTTDTRLKELEARVEMNEREVDRLWRRRYRYYPRSYYRLPREDDDSSQQ